MIMMRCDERMYSEVRELAQRRGYRSLGRLLRDILREHIDREKKSQQ